jgi:hypothetical protein
MTETARIGGCGTTPVNADLVAALERERLRGMPRWNPCPWWVDEAKRLLQAKDNKYPTPTSADDAEVA